jgi:Tol biopolymer transport system component
MKFELFQGFKQSIAPGTGRKIRQLTSGPKLNYPLYYYIPSITSDGRYLVHHGVDAAGLQIWRLDLQTGEEFRLSNASGQDTHWFPWCIDKGPGVLDHRSVLNSVRNTLVYFDGRDAIQVHVESRETSKLFTLPDSRSFIGQNCITPDGEWLVYIHHDSKTLERMRQLPYWEARALSKNTALAAYNFSTGEIRNILFINSPIHHVLPCGLDGLVFCHPNTENGMLYTTLEGGFYTHLRTQEEDGLTVCHYVSTSRGLMYELSDESHSGHRAGIYDPETHKKVEVDLPTDFRYTHTGLDPDGKLWIFENEVAKYSDRTSAHELWFLEERSEHGSNRWKKLMGPWKNYRGGQSSHCHPQITADRNWLLFVGGETESQTNQIYLMDISDLTETLGISEPLGFPENSQAILCYH